MSWFYLGLGTTCIALSFFETGLEGKISAGIGLIIVAIARVILNQEEKP